MPTVELEETKLHRWTRNEFYRLVDLGFFLGRRVELIEGEIFEMSAQKNWHAMGIKLTEDQLNPAFGPGHWVRVQMSLDLTPYSVPDPDLAVVSGGPRTHSGDKNPTTSLLIVEVSDTTLTYDQLTKGSLYARSGIFDYWILNLVDRQLEVYRDPVVDASQRYGMGYANVTILGPSDTVSPLAAPHAAILVADLLP